MAQMATSRLIHIAVCFLLITIISAASTQKRRSVNVPCPKECHCYADNTFDTTTVQCMSFEFLTNLSEKESALITSLDLSKSGIDTIDYRLKKLFNLQILNLSENKLTEIRHFPYLPKLTHLNLRSNTISSFTSKYLPTTLQVLDISHNAILELSQDILRLQHLRRIDVSGNPFSCNRESLDIKDMLLERDVHIGGHVICTSPAKFKGQLWMQTVDLDDFIKYDKDMQGDMAFDGSGEPLPEISLDGKKMTDKSDLYFSESNENFSGSGDGDLPEILYSSSTSEPDTTAVEDIILGRKFVPDVMVNIPREYSTDGSIQETSSSSSISEDTVTYEENIVTSTDLPERVLNVGPATDGANLSSGKNLGTNIFLVIFVLCLLSLIVYAYKKNKEKKKASRLNAKREEEKNVTDTELQPMKPKEKPNEKHNGNSASVPLINGQNGNTKAIEANEYPEEEVLPRKQTSPSIDKEPVCETPNVDYPSYSPTYPSTPAYPSNLNVKSVTVRAHDIPDSVPHTPILVNRSRSEDGSHIVVIPTDSPSSHIDE
ncbi:windpipe [Carabus blaptoides fortunei]